MAAVNYKVGFFVAVAVAAAAGVFAISQAASFQTRLGAAADRAEDAEQEAEDADNEVQDLEDQVDDLRRELRNVRRAQEEAAQALSLDDALASGKAVRAAGLSAAVSDFECVDRSCTAVQGTATFKNATQEGSAVTCLFRVEFENGTTSHFSWFAEYVPPKEESVTDLYFSSNNPSPVDYWYDSDECYRGVATFNPGSGDI